MNDNSILTLDKYQQNVFDSIKDNPDKNFFIQGQAGTGKSTLINYLRKNLGRNVVVVAPTGIAAQLIGGSTIHRMFHLGGSLDFFSKNIVERYRGYDKVLGKVRTLIIDEASMLRADVFDTMNTLCMLAKNNIRIFGGIQIILVGDLYQLPPVYKSKEEVWNYMLEEYQEKKPFFFDASCYKKGKFEVLKLQQVHRQNTDAEFLHNLQAICKGNAASNEAALKAAIDSLNERVEANCTNGAFSIVTAKNDQADAINRDRLAKLDGKERIYIGTFEGSYTEEEKKQEPIAPVELHLKEGARVMFCRNDTQGQRYVNGTMGSVLALADEVIKVRTEQGTVVDVYRTTWDKQEYVPVQSPNNPNAFELRTIGSYKQFPLKLAYAITIHKSQGQTWDNVCIDLGHGAFAEGQTYVALSRVKTKNGVHLARALSCNDVKVNSRVKEFLETGVRPQPTGVRTQAAPQRDENSVKEFWTTKFPNLMSERSKCRCCTHPLWVKKVNNYNRFPNPCYWFTCEAQEVEKTMFLICMDNNANSSAIFKIPACTFNHTTFHFDRTTRRSREYHYDPAYRNNHFDLFLETGGDYMELVTGVEFKKYLLATEQDYEITMVKTDEENA